MRDMPRSSAATQAPLSGSAVEVDEELLALPAPPKRERTLTVGVLGLVAAASLAMAAALAPDALYALEGTGPAVAAGELAAFRPDAWTGSHYVCLRGTVGAASALRFERPLVDGSYRVVPALGRDDLWVEFRVPPGQEGARYVPPSSFCGRLVPFAMPGLRQYGLRSGLESVTGHAVPEQAWLLVDGEEPRRAAWAATLLALFLGFAVWNVVTAARLVRRVR